jgi:cell division protein FtsL
MMRLVNIMVIAALIVAATTVYKIKFDSTLQAEKVAKLHNELRRERNAIAALRAQWARLDTPSRIERLANRYLTLRPIKPTQIGNFDNLPPRPPAQPPQPSDPIGAMLAPNAPETTGSVPATRR